MKTKFGELKFLVDTGANKNYVDPDKISTCFLKNCTPTGVKSINGKHNINKCVEIEMFNQPLTFYALKFHPYFDGLIGYESLRNLKAEILTSSNTLKLPTTSVNMLRKYPDSFSRNLNAYEEIPLPLKTNVPNGDFFVEHPLPLTDEVMILPGLYTAKDNKATVLLKNCCEVPVKISPNRLIFSELNNFEVVQKVENYEPGYVFDNTSIDPRLKNQLRIDHLNIEEKRKLINLISKFPSVFYLEGDNLSFTNVIKHRIETKDDLPVHAKSYRYPYCHKEEVQKQVSKMLSQGIIRPSTSPWCSPIWIVPKKLDASGQQKWRLVVDYRKLNEKTIDDKYPLPNITEILDKLGKCQYFTTLDLASGFHQIEVHPDDIQKTAFSVEHGLYEYLRMPFGLKNAPATFQRVMDHVLRDLIGKCCLVYMDDIIIFSVSLQEHIENLTKIFMALEKVNLKIQLDKSEFLKKEVAFLGHIVTDNGVKPNPSKIEAIQNWPIPKNQKELRGFLGILGYYRRFVRDFARITKPLTAQLRKGEHVEHTDIFLKTFVACKKLLTQSDILQYPDFEKPFVLTTDASNFALGAVLSQGAIGQDRPVAYASRTLTKTEERYSAIEKELLAIVWATQYFRPYLFGRKFTLYTDHQPLTYALNLKTPNTKLVKWRLQLLEYDFEIKHRPGKQNVVADALSRITHDINVNEDDSDSDDCSVHSADTDDSEFIKCTEKPINFFHNQIILKIDPNESETYEEIFPRVYRRTITKITFGVPLLIRILKEYMDPRRSNCIMCPENVIQSLQIVYKNYFSRCKTFKLCISQKILIDLPNLEDQNSIIEDTHETAHRGIRENLEEIKRRFFFPNMKRKVRKYIILCDTCNKAKYERKPYKIKLGETPIPKQPIEIIHIDIYIAQPNLFLSVVDKFTRYGTLIPIKSRSIADIRKAIIKYITLYGTPSLIVSDNEPAIKSIEIRGLLSDLNIQQYFTPSNHSQTNGIVERFHSTITEIFNANKHKYGEVSNKEKFLIACSLYNNSIHTATNMKPREILYAAKNGQERPIEMERLVELRDKLYDEVQVQLTKTQNSQNLYHNRKREDPPKLKQNELAYNRIQGVKSKIKDRYQQVRVRSNRKHTYKDILSRKLHKEKLRRIRK